MRSIVILLGLIALPFLSMAQMAQYEYQLEDHQIELKFMINRTDLLQFQFNECDLQADMAQCAALYISARSSFSINGIEMDFELVSNRMEGGRLVLYLRSGASSEAITEVSIENNSFYELNPAFRNLVILNLGPFQRSQVLTIDNPSMDLYAN